jgi:hypothetical protein
MCHHPAVKSAAHPSNVITLVMDAYTIALARRAMVTSNGVLMVSLFPLKTTYA